MLHKMYIEWLFGRMRKDEAGDGEKREKNNIPQVEVPLSGFYYSMARKFSSIFFRIQSIVLYDL